MGTSRPLRRSSRTVNPTAMASPIPRRVSPSAAASLWKIRCRFSGTRSRRSTAEVSPASSVAPGPEVPDLVGELVEADGAGGHGVLGRRDDPDS